MSGDETRTDAAALAAAAVGIAVPMLIGTGPWDIISAIVSASIGIIIIAYVAASHRTLMQSMGFAALIGILAMPIGGFALELVYYPERRILLHGGIRDDIGDDLKISHVDSLWLVAMYILAFALSLVCDAMFQRRRMDDNL